MADWTGNGWTRLEESALIETNADRPARSFAILTSITLMFAAAYSLLEVLRSSGSPYLVAGDAWDTTQLVLGLGGCWIAFLAPALVVWALLRAGVKRPWVRTHGAILTATIVCWGVVTALHTYAGHENFLEYVIVAAVVVVSGVGLVACQSVAGMSPVYFCWVWIGAALGGIVTLYGSSRLLFLHADRVLLAGTAAVTWTLLAGATGLAMGLYLRGKGGRPVTRFVALVVVAALFPAGLLIVRATAGRLQNTVRPQLVLVTCDAMRANYCSLYGGQVPTPNFEAIADQGVCFDRFYSLAPWTSPSMSGLFSSKYPMSMTPGSDESQWAAALGFHAETMAYWLGGDGLSQVERWQGDHMLTAAFTSNPVLRREEWMFRGYDHELFYNFMEKENRGFLWRFPVLQQALSSAFPGIDRIRPLDTTRVFRQYAEEFIRANRDKRFFLWVHLMDPHDPYDPPRRYRTMTGDWPVFSPIGGTFGSVDYETVKRGGLNEGQKDYVRSLYEGEIRYVDETVGRIARALEKQCGGNAHLCVTADHGEELWDHGRWSHGQNLYEEMVHVPLIFRGPGIVPGRVATPVSAIHLLPTLTSLMRFRPRQEWRGETLLPYLQGGTDLVQEEPCFFQGTRLAPEPLRGAVDGQEKFVQGLASGKQELYDLEADPKETQNLASGRVERTATLGQRTEEWAASFPSLITDFDTEMDESALQELEAMGYLGD